MVYLRRYVSSKPFGFHFVLFEKTKLIEIKRNGWKKEKVSEKIENENKNKKKLRKNKIKQVEQNKNSKDQTKIAKESK